PLLDRQGGELLDGTGPRPAELLQRGLVGPFVVPPLHREPIAVHIRQERLRLRENADEARSMSLDLDVSKVMNDLARRERSRRGLARDRTGRTSPGELREPIRRPL